MSGGPTAPVALAQSLPTGVYSVHILAIRPVGTAGRVRAVNVALCGKADGAPCGACELDDQPSVLIIEAAP